MARNDGRAEKQHYVPQLLLRGFAVPPKKKEQIYTFDKHEERSFLARITKIATENEFYKFETKNGTVEVETLLSDLETNTAAALKKIIDSNSVVDLSIEQRGSLCTFIAAQLLRTRHMREVVRALNEGLARHIEKFGADPKQTTGFDPIETDDDLKRHSVGYLLGSVLPMAKILSTKAVFLTTTTEDRPFWISDHPVVMHNCQEFGPYGNIGVAVPGIEIYLPLTSTQLLALWCPSNAKSLAQKYETAKTDRNNLPALLVLGVNIDRDKVARRDRELQSVIEQCEPLLDALRSGTPIVATDENVIFYNHLQVRWSHRYVMSSVENFALARRMISDNARYRRGLMPTID